MAFIRGLVWYLCNPLSTRITECLLKTGGATLGSGARIKRSLHIDNAITDENSTGDFSHLTIGANTYVGDNVYVDLADHVDIGEDVTISGDVSFITHADCNRSSWLADQFPREQAPITVKEGTWIGFGAIILAGVTIGEEAVVAAGAVVQDDVDSRTLVGGIPAETIKNITESSGETSPTK